MVECMSQRSSHHSLALVRRPTTVGDPLWIGGTLLLLGLVLVLLITNGGAG
jgi:hypothetical protein